ncbi:MAG: hypothetical protein JXA93_18210 [Anaerolineae bacterium]|nr:hypothetical protein [Anaerolineae bacterium]
MSHTAGNLVHLDFSALDVEAAHRALGRDVSAQVHAILHRKLDHLDAPALAIQARLVRACRSALDSRLTAPALDLPVRSALRHYLGSLSAWAKGAGLDRFAAENAPRLRVDGTPLTADELALWLQSEQGGCQTGIYRDDDGSIILWHTEEDIESAPGARFDRLRLFSYQAATPGKVATSFIYPDLLPGPTFGWSSDLYLQAVDSLFVRVQETRGAIFPNVVAWMRLYLGREIGTERLIRALAPYAGGYALLTVHRDEQGWQGNKIEFAGSQQLSASLSDRPGDLIFQANVFSDRESQIAQAYEEIGAPKRELFEKRITRTAQEIGTIRRSGNKIECFRRLLASKTGGDFAYSNPDVKATFLCHARGQAPLIWVGAGPASCGDELLSVTQAVTTR